MAGEPAAPVHELKAEPPWFALAYQGEKTAELRRHDRGYQVHHRLRLREWRPEDGRYTGSEVLAEITNVVTDGDGPWLASGYCMLSYKILELTP